MGLVLVGMADMGIVHHNGAGPIIKGGDYGYKVDIWALCFNQH